MKYLLKKLRKTANPSKQFRATLWAELGVRQPAINQHIRPKRKLALVTSLASITILLSGTGTYAYTSPQVTPENPLYEVKHNIERVEGLFHRSPLRKARFNNRMAERRCQEYKHAKTQQGREEIEYHLRQHLNMTKDEFAEVIQDPAQRMQIIQKTEEIRKLHELYNSEHNIHMDKDMMEKHHTMIIDRINTATPKN